MENCLENHPRQIKAHEQQARQESAGEKITHGNGRGRKVALGHLNLCIDAGQHVAHENENGRGRDDLAQGSRGADNAGSKLRIIAGAEHRGQ